MTGSGLGRQRVSWTYGNVPLVFIPLTIVVAGISLADGNWQSIAWFALFVAVTHFVISVIALTMVKESLWHLLMVPIYRLIYDQLRAYPLYADLVQAMRGR